MTLHFAITYFDEATKSTGYLLGCDSKGTLHNDTDKQSGPTVYVDKTFRGEFTIGMLRGSLVNTGPIGNAKELFEKQLRSFNHAFDNITEGSDFSELALFQQNPENRVLVAKRAQQSLDLYVVEEANKSGKYPARLLKTLTRQSYEEEKESTRWYAYPGFPCTRGFSRRLCLKEAEAHLRASMQQYISMSRKGNQLDIEIIKNHDHGEIVAYQVDFNEIKRIKVN